MSDAATALAPHPDPDRAAAACLDSVTTHKILRLLHTLIAYGRNLVVKLREEDDPYDLPWYAFLTTIFGTTNPTLIIVVITRGLLRAAALQARLGKSISALRPLSLRDDQAGRRMIGASALGPRSPRPAGWTIPPGWPAEDHSLDSQPSPQEELYAEIAAADQDRPIGAILLDICLDLAIVPGLMDHSTWNELRLAITLHGGDPAPSPGRCRSPG
jgi:hypothetical protein